MSKKTVSQMEAVLMDRIEQAKLKLDQLYQKHQLEIGQLAYKHGLHHLDNQQLNYAFAKLAKDIHHGS